MVELLHWRFGPGVECGCWLGGGSWLWSWGISVVGRAMLFELVMACLAQVVWWSFGGLSGCGVGDEALGSGGDGDGGQLWVLADGQ